MKSIFSLLFLFFAFLAVAFGADVEEEDGVLVLTEDNFEEVVNDADIILVEFYAPWCGHCKKLTPEYAKAAAVLKDHDPPIPLAKVDSTVERGLAEQFGIKGFPTLKVFKKGTATDYEGGRTESTIVSYMKKKVGPSAKPLDSVEAAEKFIEAADVAIVGFFSDAESDAAKVFLAAADISDDFAFGITSDAAVKAKYDISSDTATVFKTYDEPRTDFAIAADSSAESLTADLVGATTYLVETFSGERAKAIFGGPVQVHALIFGDDEHFSPLEAGVREMAAELKGQLLFVRIPTSESRVYDYFGVKTTDVPQFAISDMSTEGSNKKFFFEGAMEAAAMRAYVDEMLAGKLSPTLKSEEPAEEDLEDPVKVVKGKSFEDIVINNDKDVLLEFYAPWCGHCKSLAPIYDELAEKFEGVDSVVIAKMDATANEIDHPKVNVRGFPTIYFFPGNSKHSPLTYNGSRDLEGFMKYLQDNAVTPFELEGAPAGSVTEEL